MRWLVLILVNLQCLVVSAQEFPELIPFNKNGKWGYSDVNRKIFLDPVFEEAGLFKDGVARVVVKGKPTWIDTKGLPASPPVPSDPKKKKGYDIFMKNNKFGVADGMKKVIIEAGYDSISHGIVDENGDPDYSRKLFIVKTKKGSGIIDKEDKVIVPLTHSKCSPFQNGFSVCRKNEKYGAYNLKGKQVIDFKYDGISAGNDGIFRVITKITKDSSVVAFLDGDGKQVFPKTYKDAEDFWYGLAAFSCDTAWGYLAKDGGEQIPCKFSLGTPFMLDSGKFACVVMKDSLNKLWYGIIDRDGNYVVKPEYQKFVNHPGQSLFHMVKEGRHGFIGSNGQVIIPFEYEEAGAPQDGFIPVKKDGKWGVMDTGGNSLIAPFYEGELGVAGMNLFWVKDLSGSLKGYINIYGTEYWGETK